MVEQIGESSFKAKAHPLVQVKCLGKSGGNCARAWPQENAHPTVSDGAGRYRIEGTWTEHAAGRRIRDVAIANAIGPLESAAIGETQVPWIVAGTGDGREVGTSFPQADRAEGPSAERQIDSPIHV